MIRLGIIADDFTGATDVAGLAVGQGASASVVTGKHSPSTDGALASALKIRTIARDEAIEKARWAAKDHLAEGRKLYWKYCSTFQCTPRGNIGPVADALLDHSGAVLAVHCPAFPEKGCTVYMGRLFVGDVPLDESPMEDNPLTPMRDANLLGLLAPQVQSGVSLLTRDKLLAGDMPAVLAEARRLGHRRMVADAMTNDNPAVLARETPAEALLCGGSAFAAASLGKRNAEGQPSRTPRGPILVLSGSCSSATRGQVAAWTGKRLDLTPEALAAEAQVHALDWLERELPGGHILISATAEPDLLQKSQQALGKERAARLVEDAMSALVEGARDAGAAGIVVAGGETPGAATRALGADHLRIGAEVAPGVPVCLALGNGNSIALDLKSGNFGNAVFFAVAVCKIEEMQ